MNDIGGKIGAIVASIIGVAILAVVISSRANTVNVITAFFSGVSNLVGVAISPVTGQSTGANAQGLPGGSWSSSGGTGGSLLGGYSGSSGSNGLGGGINIGSIFSGLGSLGGGSSGGSGLNFGSILGGSSGGSGALSLDQLGGASAGGGADWAGELLAV